MSRIRDTYNKILLEAKVIKVNTEELIDFDYNIPLPYLNVYKNPTKSELKSILQNSKENMIRGLLIDDDVYVWDAYYTNHASIMDILDDSNSNILLRFIINEGKLGISEDMFIGTKNVLTDKKKLLNSKLHEYFTAEEILNAPHHEYV